MKRLTLIWLLILPISLVAQNFQNMCFTYDEKLFDPNVIVQYGYSTATVTSIRVEHDYDDQEYKGKTVYYFSTNGKIAQKIEFNDNNEPIDTIVYGRDVKYEYKPVDCGKYYNDSTRYTFYMEDESDDPELENIRVITETYGTRVKLTNIQNGLPWDIVWILMPYESPYYRFEFKYEK